MCCAMSTKTSSLIKSAFSLGHEAGRGDAAGGHTSARVTMKAAKRAVTNTCTCDTSRRARKFIARAYLLGYEAGFTALFAAEVAARDIHSDPAVVNIEAARSARVAREAECNAPLVVGD